VLHLGALFAFCGDEQDAEVTEDNAIWEVQPPSHTRNVLSSCNYRSL